MPEPTTVPTSGSEQVKPESSPAPEPKFSQADVDRIVQERLNRDRAKFSDYDDLRKKASEYEKQQEHLTQLELEKKQEYDKLRDQWNKDRSQLEEQLNKTRADVQAERVSNSLNTEILRKNAYPEAAQLLRSMAKYNEDGTITIRGKDANGIETDLSVEQGVEQFLKERPYLVKGSGQGGAGTSSSPDGVQNMDQRSLVDQWQDAKAVGDHKRALEIKNKIRAKHSSGAMVSF